MFDTIEKSGNSVIQHGPYNDRVYLMHLAAIDYPGLVSELIKIALEKKYSKIFAKVPDWAAPEFDAFGFVKEAEIPDFFNAGHNGLFYAKYLFSERQVQSRKDRRFIQQIITLANEKKKKGLIAKKNSQFVLAKLSEPHTNELSSLYGTVFKTYPFPIFDKNYLISAMSGNTDFYGVYHSNTLVAAASTEKDPVHKTAEMTDFATLPDFRGNNLALLLLREMEAHMRLAKYNTLYTIARSMSPGMNITFAKNGYEYAGTLKNNTNISGNIESMNVWYKHLS
jgi:putative beta-lysine N-acetyltransferase